MCVDWPRLACGELRVVLCQNLALSWSHVGHEVLKYSTLCVLWKVLIATPVFLYLLRLRNHCSITFINCLSARVQSKIYDPFLIVGGRLRRNVFLSETTFLQLLLPHQKLGSGRENTKFAPFQLFLWKCLPLLVEVQDYTVRGLGLGDGVLVNIAKCSVLWCTYSVASWCILFLMWLTLCFVVLLPFVFAGITWYQSKKMPNYTTTVRISVTR